MSLGFPMLSGVHQASYATNSGPQNSVLLRCRPLLERAIAMQQAQFQEMKRKIGRIAGDRHDIFRIADIGCSTGPNCLTNMQFMLDSIAKYYDGNDDADDCHNGKSLEVQPFFCDLPSNDFNTLFQLHHAQFPHAAHQGFFPAAAVAGTAYGRLFPASSLHLIFSSLCLHWLSQIPTSILKPNTKEWNNGKIWVDGPKANEAAGRAYAHQWQEDLQEFFKSRSEEMVFGGMMFLVIPCRPDIFPPHQMQDESCFRNMELSWKQLIEEGVLEQSDLDTFNIPQYLPTLGEITSAVNVIPNLRIQSLKLIEEAIGDNYWKQWSHDPSELAKRMDDFYRSVFWNVTEVHVGNTKCEAIFGRFKQLLKNNLENLSHWDSYRAFPWSSFAALQVFKGT